MLESLNEEQKALMEVVRDEWTSLFFDNVKGRRGIDKTKFEEGIDWLYKDLLKRPIPEIVYCDSWLSCLVTIAILKNNKDGNSVGNSVRDCVSDSIWDSVGASFWTSVGASIKDPVLNYVWNSVGDSVMAFVGGSIRDSISDSVWDSIKDSVGDIFYQYSSYIDLSKYGWISFYAYFERLGLLDNFNFKQYKNLMKSGVFNAYEYENYIFAIQPPIYIERDSLGELHSVNGSSVRFRDDCEYFFIHGVAIKAEMYKELLENTYSFESFVKEHNEGIKAAALSFIEEKHGNEFLFRFISSNLKQIDTYVDKKDEKYLAGTTGGMNIGVYTLFKGRIGTIDLAFVRCYCPSTDRMFFLSVDPENTNAKDGIASLYRVPKKLDHEIKSISRQGERFSTVFTKKGNEMLKSLPKEDISDLIHISGDRYFSLMNYEF